MEVDGDSSENTADVLSQENQSMSGLLRDVHHPNETSEPRQWNAIDMMQRDVHTGNLRGKAYPPEIVARACTRLARGESIREVSKTLRISESWLHTKRKQIAPFIAEDGTCTIIPAPLARSGGRSRVMTLEQQRALTDMAVRMRSRPVHKLVEDMKHRFPELNISVSTAQRCLRSAGVRMVQSKEGDPNKGLGSVHEEQLREFVSAQAHDLFDPFQMLFLDESTFTVLSSTQKIYSMRKEETTEVTKGVGDGFSVIAGIMLRRPGSEVPKTLTPQERARLHRLGLNIGTPEQETHMIIFWGILTGDGLRAPVSLGDKFTRDDIQNRLWTYKDIQGRLWPIDVDEQHDATSQPFVLNELDVGKNVHFSRKLVYLSVGMEREAQDELPHVENDKKYLIVYVKGENVILQLDGRMVKTTNVRQHLGSDVSAEESNRPNPTSLAALQEFIHHCTIDQSKHALLLDFLIRNDIKATVRTVD
eukprot:6214367-Pleurochrysis_carterae.AAC.1